ncbi:MAG: T9SS type A sorting domain-containing protein [Bacteroidia bacterium]|nr:T9SS type A sorting domain-containing protein [Bacteroidia bacterium]
MTRKFTSWTLLIFLLGNQAYLHAQTTPASGDIVITHASSDGDDIVEFITLKRLNLSTLGVTDNGICSSNRFRLNETTYTSGFSSLTDVPAGTYIRLTDNNQTNETNTTDGIVTLGNHNISFSNDGDQVILYTGTANGAQDCGTSTGTNTYIAGINIADTNWGTGASNSNNSKAPGSSADYDTGNSDNNQINPGTALTGTAAQLRTALLTGSNWQGSNSQYTGFSLKDIQFNASDFSTGVIGVNPTDNSATLDLSGLTFSNTTTDTRYVIVIRQAGTPATPADRYTCYNSITTDMTTAPFIATSVATPPCTTPTNSTNTRIVYFGYTLPVPFTVSGLTTSASYTVNVYAVNGNGYSANFGTAGTVTFTASTPLPIELVDFRAQVAGINHVTLSWGTAQEINNDYIAVERSTDGQHFAEIGQVAGAGTSDTYTQYVFDDRDVFQGTHYYRLRQVDLDGQATVFPAIEVYMPAATSRWTLYPQPVLDKMILTASTQPEAAVRIQVLNLQGQVLLQQDTKPGAVEVVVDLGGLAAGMYLVRISESGQYEAVRIIKD